MSMLFEIVMCFIMISLCGFFYLYYWKHMGQKQKYIDLYELWKLDELLRVRGLSFKALDEFELKLVAEKKNAIVAIDEFYKREKAELKKGK